MTNQEINEAVGKVQWYKSAKGKAYSRKYRKVNSAKHAQYKRESRKHQADKFPEKVRCRKLLGMAVRLGFISMPEDNRNWHNKWQFHHPYYDKPYLGVWVSVKDHSAIHHGKIACPPVTDYTGQVFAKVLERFGLSEVSWTPGNLTFKLPENSGQK